jgi:acetyltransferase-like isoleucine patch superfamily enzyme
MSIKLILKKIQAPKIYAALQKIYFRLNCVGHYTSISLRANFIGSKENISIGAGCIIEAGVTLVCVDRNSKLVIGDGCVIKSGTYLDTGAGGFISIGKRVSLNPYCVIYGHGGLEIGDDVRIATHTVIIPANHVFDSLDILIREQGLIKKGIIIKSNVWIGCGVRILDGVHVGKGAVIAAGSVVTKVVNENCVVAGVPAKTIYIRK